jgi:hypothetical protein
MMMMIATGDNVTRKRPFEDTRLVKFLEKRVLELRPVKSQVDIAAEAGFRSVNMLAMIKNGTTRLPFDRVPALAKALDCDPRRLFLLALTQDGGSTTEAAIYEIFGTIVTSNEVAWLTELRNASDHSDPSLTARSRTAFRAIFGR